MWIGATIFSAASVHTEIPTHNDQRAKHVFVDIREFSKVAVAWLKDGPIPMHEF